MLMTTTFIGGCGGMNNTNVGHLADQKKRIVDFM